jgi:hypothetical protein
LPVEDEQRTVDDDADRSARPAAANVRKLAVTLMTGALAPLADDCRAKAAPRSGYPSTARISLTRPRRQ